MLTSSTLSLRVSALLLAVLAALSTVQAQNSLAADTLQQIPEELRSACVAFKSKASGDRLEEGQRVLSLIQRPSVSGADMPTNFLFMVGLLRPGLSESNIPALLGEPNLVYTKQGSRDTNVTCFAYTCGRLRSGCWLEFSINFDEVPMVCVVDNSVISASRSRLAEREVLPDLKANYLQLISMLKSGDLVPDASGRVNLPESYKMSIVGHELLVTHTNGSLLVAFRTWAGGRDNMEGYLYSDRPLKVSDPKEPGGLQVGPLLLQAEKAIDDNWYRAAHRAD